MSEPIIEVNADKGGGEATNVTVSERLKRGGKRFAQKTKAAAQLTAKQAEKTKIKTVSLPPAYLALGKEVFNAGRFKDDFEETYIAVDEVRQQIATLEQNSPSDGEETFSSKAKAAAKSIKDTATAKALSGKARDLVRQLGRQSFEKYGAKSGSKDVVVPVQEHLDRLLTLDAEIDDIEQVHTGGIVTPRRLAIGAGILLLLVVLGSFVNDEDEPDAGKKGKSSSSKKRKEEKTEKVGADKSDEYQRGFDAGYRDAQSYVDIVRRFNHPGLVNQRREAIEGCNERRKMILDQAERTGRLSSPSTQGFFDGFTRCMIHSGVPID